MTAAQWRSKVRKWARRLNMADVSIAVSVDDAMADREAEAGFLDRRASQWYIRFRSDVPDAEEVVVHELLHVKSGLLDARDEEWITDVSRALVRGWRNK